MKEDFETPNDNLILKEENKHISNMLKDLKISNGNFSDNCMKIIKEQLYRSGLNKTV